MHPILQKLSDGDRRSIGRADEVASEITDDPSLFEVVLDAMRSENALLRMRASDAVEKASRSHPELLRPYKALLLHEISASEQQEVRWHVAQMFSRLDLDERERETAVRVLKQYLRDESRIVRTNALQALADIAAQDQRYRPEVVAILREAVSTGSAAMRARGRKLLEELGRDVHE